LKKFVIPFLKFAIPVAIIAWLLASVDKEGFQRLRQQDKNWSLLTCGAALVSATVCVTFVRWYLLVRALDLRFRIADAFRLAFLGYLLNFIGGGSVGGDLFKAIFIAREQPGRRTEAVATVAMDRVVGLFALLLVTSTAILAAGVSSDDWRVEAICDFMLVVTAIAIVFVVLILIPRFRAGRFVQAITRLPKIGPTLERLIAAVGVYRGKPLVLASTFAMSVFVHVSLCVAIYLAAAAIFVQPPTMAEHFIIVPLSMCAGAVPLAPGGLGEFEAAMGVLYMLLPAHRNDNGIVVALVYRLMTVLIAVIGAVYYWSSRREVTEILEEAEREQKGQSGRSGSA
jgi:uncharacterized protein (TIRG00374 family)